MTPVETLTLAAYFFVLIILAIYGWHRYYLVYLYMSNRDKEPKALPAARSAAGRHDPAAALQRDVRRRSADRGGLRDRLPARAARNPGAGRLDRRDAQHRRVGGAPLGRAGHRHQVHPPRRPHRLQGGRARGGPQGRARRVHRDFRRRLHPDARFPDAADAALRRREGRHGAGALGPHQPGLLAADEDPGDPARRPLHARARRPQPRRPVLQLQRDRRASGGAPRSTTPAAGSTTRSPRISI